MKWIFIIYGPVTAGLAVWLVAALCAVHHGAAAPAVNPLPASSTPASSRYQLLSANCTVTGPGGPELDPFTFKLDTQTGRTWVFVCSAKSPSMRIGWIELGSAGYIGLPDFHPTNSPTP